MHGLSASVVCSARAIGHVPPQMLGDTLPSITPAPAGCQGSGLQEGDGISQAHKEAKAAKKKREPAMTCSEAQGEKEEQG